MSGGDVFAVGLTKSQQNGVSDTILVQETFSNGEIVRTYNISAGVTPTPPPGGANPGWYMSGQVWGSFAATPEDRRISFGQFFVRREDPTAKLPIYDRRQTNAIVGQMPVANPYPSLTRFEMGVLPSFVMSIGGQPVGGTPHATYFYQADLKHAPCIIQGWPPEGTHKCGEVNVWDTLKGESRYLEIIPQTKYGDYYKFQILPVSYDSPYFHSTFGINPTLNSGDFTGQYDTIKATYAYCDGWLEEAELGVALKLGVDDWKAVRMVIEAPSGWESVPFANGMSWVTGPSAIVDNLNHLFEYKYSDRAVSLLQEMPKLALLIMLAGLAWQDERPPVEHVPFNRANPDGSPDLPSDWRNYFVVEDPTADLANYLEWRVEYSPSTKATYGYYDRYGANGYIGRESTHYTKKAKPSESTTRCRFRLPSGSGPWPGI